MGLTPMDISKDDSDSHSDPGFVDQISAPRWFGNCVVDCGLQGCTAKKGFIVRSGKGVYH